MFRRLIERYKTWNENIKIYNKKISELDEDSKKVALKLFLHDYPQSTSQIESLIRGPISNIRLILKSLNKKGLVKRWKQYYTVNEEEREFCFDLWSGPGYEPESSLVELLNFFDKTTRYELVPPK